MKTEKDTPREWIIENLVTDLDGRVYGCPSCPSCKEPTYGLERCAFCNQKLKEPKGE